MAIDPAEREMWLWRACNYDEPLFQQLRARIDAASQAARPPAAQSGTGPYIGPYKLIRELGRGGMGVVHLAVRDDGAFRKIVALKLLQGDVSPDFIKRFRNERQVLAPFEHPNIARIIDGGDAPDGMPYYVMEYVDGEPVDQYCDTHRLSLTNRLKIFLQICHAVQYLHKNSTLHRDLKPANIFVSQDGTVKLLDFGIAKATDPTAFNATGATGAQGPLMTPGYASPEQMAGETLGPPSDIYALGTILFILLTGRQPFESYAEKIANMQNPPRPSANIRADLQATDSTAQLRRSMLGELDSIVLKSLRVNPRDRYASADDLAADLQRFLDGEPVAAHHESAAARSLRVLRRKWTLLAGAAALLALSGVAIWQWQAARRGSAETTAREAEVSAREAHLRGVLEQMERRLDSAGTQPQIQERIADVSQVRQAFAKDYPAIAARSRGADPLMPRAIRYLDRVQTAAPGVAPLGVELADAYQEFGVMQENVAPTQEAKSAALATYQKAAATLAVCPAEPAVVERIAMVKERVEKLGGQVEEAAAPPAPEPAPADTKPAPPPVAEKKTTPRPADPVTRPNTAPPPVATTPKPTPAPVAEAPKQTPPPSGIPADLMDDLNRAEARIQLAESTIAPIAANLERQGMTLNADTQATIGRMKAMLEKGRQEMLAGKAAAAKESFNIARVLADRVLKSVGR